MNFDGKKILIIGAGLSGISAAELLTGTGSEVILYDANVKGNLSNEDIMKKLPGNFTGRVVLGEMTKECTEDLDLLILSPGVPKDLPVVLEIEKAGVKIIGEIELAYYFSRGRIVGVTGTNGKTTTTALTGYIIGKYVENTLVVGNIGIPYTRLVKTSTEDSVTVAELSSFQLDTIETFHPNVGMVLNITPDHLDRHHTMENYIAAKMNVALNQTENDICILNYEDEILRKEAEKIKSRVMWFSSAHKLDNGMYYDAGVIYYAKDGVSEPVVEVDKMILIGLHNYENVMAAVACAISLGIPTDIIRDAVYSFTPVAHRIEYVATKNGVKYYNDSKGTNPDASIKAVNAMTTPTYLIGGGYDKNSEYDEWIESFDGKIKHLLLMGQTREKIAACCEKHGFTDYSFVESMEEAVKYCSENAVQGETVLLSPCCASWGMFKNYEERGDIFKELVRAL